MSPFSSPDPFEPPSLLHLFLTSPSKFALRSIHKAVQLLRCQPTVRSDAAIRVVCISDTHTQRPRNVPDGDLLIHAGDLTNAGSTAELQAQIEWLNSLSHTHKVVIAGNHDTYLDPRSRASLGACDVLKGALDWGSLRYLQHSSATLEFPTRKNRKLRVYGAPQIPACGGPEHAFQYPRGSDAWTDTVPRDTDILVTHTPPKYHRDLPVGLGCEWLLKEIWQVRPRLHVFGHVHAGWGREVAYWDEAQRAYEKGCARRDGFFTSFVNIFLWIDIAKVVCYGLSSLVWQRVWGGEDRASWLLNASVMYINTGNLDNPPQIIDI